MIYINYLKYDHRQNVQRLTDLCRTLYNDLKHYPIMTELRTSFRHNILSCTMRCVYRRGLITEPSLISTKYFQFRGVFSSSWLVTASNNGYSSASGLESSLKGGSFQTEIFLLESELLCDWRFTTNQFTLATNPLRPTTSSFIFQMNTWGYSPYLTSSLTRGWICSLQLLLALASPVILGSESRMTRDHILLSIRCSPNLEDQVPVFISPMNRVAGYTPRHWVSFSSPPRLARVQWRYFELFFCQSQSHVTTDGQSASLSWNKAPIWGLRPSIKHSFQQYLYFCMRICCRGNDFTEPLHRKECCFRAVY
jgi:hypothetical protein